MSLVPILITGGALGAVAALGAALINYFPSRLTAETGKRRATTELTIALGDEQRRIYKQAADDRDKNYDRAVAAEALADAERLAKNAAEEDLARMRYRCARAGNPCDSPISTMSPSCEGEDETIPETKS